MLLNMRVLLVLFFYLIVTITRLMGSGGARVLVVENLLHRQQMLVLNICKVNSKQIVLTKLFTSIFSFQFPQSYKQENSER